MTFYANDSAGNIASDTVNIIKDTSTDNNGDGNGMDQIPSYPLLIFVPLALITMISLVLFFWKEL